MPGPCQAYLTASVVYNGAESCIVPVLFFKQTLTSVKRLTYDGHERDALAAEHRLPTALLLIALSIFNKVDVRHETAERLRKRFARNDIGWLFMAVLYSRPFYIKYSTLFPRHCLIRRTDCQMLLRSVTASLKKATVYTYDVNLLPDKLVVVSEAVHVSRDCSICRFVLRQVGDWLAVRCAALEVLTSKLHHRSNEDGAKVSNVRCAVV